MTMLAILFFALAVAGSIAEPQEPYRGHRLVSVQAETREQLEFLASLEDSDYTLDFWTGPSLVRPTDIRVPPQQFGHVMAMMKSAGLKPEVVQSDIQTLVDEEREAMARRPKNTEPNITAEYLTFDEISDWILKTENSYRDNMKVTVAGFTHEGRRIMHVKVAADLGKPKKAIFIECLTHAREWISGSSCLTMIHNLLTDTDGGYEMLSIFDFHFFPAHNPDGYAYTHSDYRFWRKNREPVSGSSCIGIDLNRNWNSNFGGVGSSGDPCSDIYRGGYELSSAETYALHNTIAGTADVVAFFAIHSYGNYILLPWGYKAEPPSDYADLMDAGFASADAIEAVHGEYFRVGSGGDILYAASGGSEDHMRMNFGMKWTYTFELRAYKRTGFELPPEYIKPATEETWAGIKAFANYINQYV